MTSERGARRLTPEERAVTAALFGDEDGVHADQAPVVIPLIHGEKQAAEIAKGVEEVVGWGHMVTVSIGEKDRWDPSGLRVARLVLSDGTVSYHGAGRTAEDALLIVLDPITRVLGDFTQAKTHPNSGGLDRLPRSVAFSSSLLDHVLQTHALSIGVSSESGSITTALTSRGGGISRGSGENFPVALQSAIEGIRRP